MLSVFEVVVIGAVVALCVGVANQAGSSYSRFK
ncbi:hypothetical protein KHV-MN_00035 [Cyprinid herpesvirus 3]|nr:hypothetical protein KHV-MN_00035 [Cyprinid herpesvirus 3]